MELLLKRIALKPNYTIGKLYIDGKYFCDTLEDTDRGLSSSMSVENIYLNKIKGKTCIPKGTYKITLDVVSTKYSNFTKYSYTRFCNGKMPRLLEVPGFSGILIHAGNTPEDTDGCILVGENKAVGKVINSQKVWKKLYGYLQEGKQEGIVITIQ